MTAEDVLKVAQSFAGYKEKASNANLDEPDANAGDGNYTRFARDLDAVRGFYNGPKNGAPWCDVFVDACVYYASGEDKDATLRALCQPEYSAGAGCLYSADYYKKAGRWTQHPVEGAQVFFSYAPGEVSHTGLVEKVNAATIVTIEGNSGNCVARRVYNRIDDRIYGYGLPRYDGDDPLSHAASGATAPPEGEPRTQTYTVKIGDTIWGIARQHGLTMSQLAEINNIPINAVIHPGDVLIVGTEERNDEGIVPYGDGSETLTLEERIKALEERVAALEQTRRVFDDYTYV